MGRLHPRRDNTPPRGLLWHRPVAVALVLAAVGVCGQGGLSLPPSCAPVTQCEADSDCRSCISALDQHLTPSISWMAQRPYEIGFLSSLVTVPACRASPVSIADVAWALHSWHASECGHDRVGFLMCQVYEAECFANPPCGECAAGAMIPPPHLDTVPDVRRALTSLACNQSNRTLIENLAGNCAVFPACSYAKLQCTGLCAVCWNRVIAGDGAGAVSLCRNASANTNTVLDHMMWHCTHATNVGCEYQQARCEADVLCAPCFAAMNHGASVSDVARGSYNPYCVAMASNWTSKQKLLLAFAECKPWPTTVCAVQALFCVADSLDSGECAACLEGNATNATRCNELYAAWQIDTACQPCSRIVHLINHITVATAAVGAVSVVGCLVVVVIILGFHKDATSLYYRIVIGLMLANAVYSSANAIPVNLLETSAAKCGEFTLPYSTIRFGRAWWFGGKYAIVFLELWILGAAVWMLHRGTNAMSPRRERCVHAACLAGGVAAFVTFYVCSFDISANGYNANTLAESKSNERWHVSLDDDVQDDDPKIGATERYTNARQEYDRLVQIMLQVWACFLALAFVLWVYLRRTFVLLLKAWRAKVVNAEARFDRDLWAAHQQGERTTKMRILLMAKEVYEDIARPLEPFVVVFVLFGVPAVVMATDFCRDNSQVKSESGLSSNYVAPTVQYGTCDVWCEFALAFRSTATVGVFFARKGHRGDLLQFATAARRLCSRVVGWCGGRPAGRVAFKDGDLEQVHMIEPAMEAAAAGTRGDRGAAVPYQAWAEGDDDESSS